MLQSLCFGAGFPGAALYLGLAEHGSSALRRSAVTVFVAVVAVVEVVLVGELLAGCDVADSGDEDPSADVFALAVWIAGVIDEHRSSEAINDHSVVSTTEEIRDEAVLIPFICFVFGKARSVVLTDARTFFDGLRGVAARGVNRGRTNDQSIKHSQIGSIEIK